MNNNQSNSIPSVENREALKNLSKNYKPVDVKFLLAPNLKFSKEECIDDANILLKGFMQFKESGYSDTKLGFHLVDDINNI